MKIVRHLILITLLTLFCPTLIACGSSKSTTQEQKKVGKVVKKKATASYYADRFNGKKTASGDVFNNKKQTCAHRTLPFGTVLKVTNLANQKWVEVVVNDRGPHKKSREIDLTKKAFMDITDNKNSGEITVKIEIFE